MFHVEMRSGMHVVREFNLSEQRLWLGFLTPLMEDHDFIAAGQEFTPRKTRLKVYEGPELRTDQLALGRGWQNVERTATDVTQHVLQRAREHTAQAAAPSQVELLRERLIGRISAGPVGAPEILALAAELLPDAPEQERATAAQQVAWSVLEHGGAQLAASER